MGGYQRHKPSSSALSRGEITERAGRSVEQESSGTFGTAPRGIAVDHCRYLKSSEGDMSVARATKSASENVPVFRLRRYATRHTAGRPPGPQSTALAERVR